MPELGRGFADIHARLVTLKASGAARVMKALSQEGVAQTMACFRESRDPYGAAWAPLKSRSGKPLLKTGRGRASIAVSDLNPTALSFRIGTNVRYTRVHQGRPFPVEQARELEQGQVGLHRAPQLPRRRGAPRHPAARVPADRCARPGPHLGARLPARRARGDGQARGRRSAGRSDGNLMGLTNILTAINADLQAQFTSQLYPAFQNITFKIAGRELTANDAWPRIVWVRGAGSYGPVQQGVRAVRTTARILRTHEARVDAHVWCAPNSGNHNDDSDTELLAHTLVASCYRVAHGSFEVLGDDWPQPEWMTGGYLCVVAFKFLIPVTDVAPSVATAGPPWTFPFDQSTAPPPSGELQAPGDD
jgi:phage gpG-like protein